MTDYREQYPSRPRATFRGNGVTLNQRDVDPPPHQPSLDAGFVSGRPPT